MPRLAITLRRDFTAEIILTGSGFFWGWSAPTALPEADLRTLSLGFNVNRAGTDAERLYQDAIYQRDHKGAVWAAQTDSKIKGVAGVGGVFFESSLSLETLEQCLRQQINRFGRLGIYLARIDLILLVQQTQAC